MNSSSQRAIRSLRVSSTRLASARASARASPHNSHHLYTGHYLHAGGRWSFPHNIHCHGEDNNYYERSLLSPFSYRQNSDNGTSTLSGPSSDILAVTNIRDSTNQVQDSISDSRVDSFVVDRRSIDGFENNRNTIFDIPNTFEVDRSRSNDSPDDDDRQIRRHWAVRSSLWIARSFQVTSLVHTNTDCKCKQE